MIFTVKVKVEVVRSVTVEAATIDHAERLGLEKAKELSGGVDGYVMSVQSFPNRKDKDDQ